MKNQKIRSMKVHEQSGYNYKANLTTCYGIEDTGALEYTIGHLMMALIEEELPEDFEDYIQNREGVDYIPWLVILIWQISLIKSLARS